MSINRRQFLSTTAAVGSACVVGFPRALKGTAGHNKSDQEMRFGLVTYLWGQDLELDALLDTCERSGLLGVELRTQHAHGVEPSLDDGARREVRARFADSPVDLVGYGSNAQFHERDPERVKQNIELTKRYVDLMHDCGGSGVKVKPNGFVDGVPRERTIEQIGRSLNEVAAYGADKGQEIRVEVHGSGTSELPVIKSIFEFADHPNVGVCWNCNGQDLQGGGLQHNFDLVKNRFGSTVHVRELGDENYPYTDLMRLLTEMDYTGWILLEARGKIDDKVIAMTEQREIFERLIKAP